MIPAHNSYPIENMNRAIHSIPARIAHILGVGMPTVTETARSVEELVEAGGVEPPSEKAPG